MGAFLDKPITDKYSEEGADMENGIRFGLCCMQGWRMEMEDAHIAATHIPELPGWSFFAILDGHAGSFVSENSAKLLLTAILSTPELKKKGIKNGFLLLPEAKAIDDRSGTTVVCSFITPTQIIVINCGDSRGVLFSGKGQNGNVVLATMDHKPILPKERERIVSAGGYVMIQRINGSLAVSRALGDFDYKAAQGRSPWEQMVSSEPDLYIYDRNPYDQFLILACDGIWDVISNRDSCDLVRSRLLITKDLKTVTCNLIDTCFAKGSKDNMSAIVVCFKGAPKDTPEARMRDMALNVAIESKVAEILKKPLMYEVTDIVQYVITMLEKENITDLPPGGGIFAKY
ncbi:hypothetical protein HELRODRAFT_157743 [Helobdella robusta]|uniref:PPM-type phosphatase domain-containing protein n=1 Tax=Helobdella robusta TaxID=6412 RepID=T1EMF3_HELRO|nr:hypothetical protein HELRODRAFT_157743 [Helobdella robusta]ESN94860.1 hypothetical protein HELRODRAFT_157743 [Helobdella robusta]